MKESNWVVIIIFLIMVFGICLVSIDASISAVGFQASLDCIGIKGDTVLTNGLWVTDPIIMYHVCAWIAMVCMMSISMIAIHHMRLDKEVNQ